MKRLSLALLLPGLVALCFEPARWLVGTWIHAGYDSVGAWVFALCVALVLRSVVSGPRRPAARATTQATLLLLGAAGIRLAGRLLDVNHIGAMALALDAWALGLALGLHTRPWAVNPGRLAALFALSLPIKQLLQHFLGFPLRLASTQAAAVVLRLFEPGLEVDGTLLSGPGAELAVDLPCSGAQGLFLLAVAAMAMGSIRQVRPATIGLGLLAVLGGALLANALRLVVLFLGPTEELLAEPTHSLVGLAALGVGVLPAALLAWRAKGLAPEPGDAHPGPGLPPVAAGVLSLVAIAASLAPGKPLDVSEAIEAPGLPTNIGAWAGQARPLSDKEALYFERFGGSVDKRVYGGEHAAMLIRTTMPVRHLHAPHNCLLGAGHEVTRLGVEPGHIPTTVYKTVDPQGDAWRIEASFVDTTGAGVASVSQVFWRWARTPDGAWSLVERIHPWSACEAAPQSCDAFDAALFSALDLEVP